MRVRVPATNHTPATTVEYDPETGTVLHDGVDIGRACKGTYSYAPKAAGHGGRIVRFHKSCPEWQARSRVHSHIYRGNEHWGKNTRKAAIAFLLAAAAGASSPDHIIYRENKNG